MAVQDKNDKSGLVDCNHYSSLVFYLLIGKWTFAIIKFCFSKILFYWTHNFSEGFYACSKRWIWHFLFLDLAKNSFRKTGIPNISSFTVETFYFKKTIRPNPRNSRLNDPVGQAWSTKKRNLIIFYSSKTIANTCIQANMIFF